MQAEEHCDDAEILASLFRNAQLHLLKRGITKLTCITNVEWAASALREHLNFGFVGNLANYVKLDWYIPEFGNSTVEVSEAVPDDTDEILSVDRVSFPEFWQQEEHILVSILNRGGYLLKAEWERMIVGYASGVWGQWARAHQSSCGPSAVAEDGHRHQATRREHFVPTQNRVSAYFAQYPGGKHDVAKVVREVRLQTDRLRHADSDEVP